MKRWRKKDEWMDLAYCGGSLLHTVDDPTPDEAAEAKSVCSSCPVRPECIEWALETSACSVFVAGTYLPDPCFKKELRQAFSRLRAELPAERKRSGMDL